MDQEQKRRETVERFEQIVDFFRTLVVEFFSKEGEGKNDLLLSLCLFCVIGMVASISFLISTFWYTIPITIVIYTMSHFELDIKPIERRRDPGIELKTN